MNYLDLKDQKYILFFLDILYFTKTALAQQLQYNVK